MAFMVIVVIIVIVVMVILVILMKLMKGLMLNYYESKLIFQEISQKWPDFQN
jgi:hypothetical protein